jgi:hypothetical protein
MFRSSLSRVIVIRKIASTSDGKHKPLLRSNRRNLAERNAALDAYFKSAQTESNNWTALSVDPSSSEKDDIKGNDEVWRNEERRYLLMEASYLSKCLFRTCLRSIRLMRPGNEHDEAGFRAMEKKQKQQLENGDFSGSFQPPVDREDELESRVNYYHMHLRENFDSDASCLDRDPWVERDLSIYLHFLRSGEKKRRYVLQEYKFGDPYQFSFDEERVKRFEERAKALINCHRN